MRISEINDRVDISTQPKATDIQTKPSEKPKPNNADKEENIEKYDFKKNPELENIIRQSELKIRNFEILLSGSFSKQSKKADFVSDFYKNKRLFSKLNTYSNMNDNVSKAEKAISEDGYYGVEKTSKRILDFAKAIAGDDAKKLENLRGAIEKGFKKVEKMYGNKLPDVSKKTYEKVMSTFDMWQGKTNKPKNA